MWPEDDPTGTLASDAPEDEPDDGDPHARGDDFDADIYWHVPDSTENGDT